MRWTQQESRIVSRTFVDLLTPEEEALIRLGGSQFLVVAQSKPNIIRLWLANKTGEVKRYAPDGTWDMKEYVTEQFRVTRYLGRTKNKSKRATTLETIKSLGLRYTLLPSKNWRLSSFDLDWSLITRESHQP